MGIFAGSFFNSRFIYLGPAAVIQTKSVGSDPAGPAKFYVSLLVLVESLGVIESGALGVMLSKRGL